MLTLTRRIRSRLSLVRTRRRLGDRRALADRFLAIADNPELAPSPNGNFWFMAMPLPDGRRVVGVSPDVNREQKLWASCFGADRDCLAGKRVLDVGANDGFFSIAAALCGAKSVHSVNTGDLIHGTYPANLRFAGGLWGVRPRVTVGDFQDLPANGPEYDAILFFGVFYHLENVYGGLRVLDRVLAAGGTIFLETQVTKVESDLPVLEVASDAYPTTVPQIHCTIGTCGNSNYLLPNPAAVRALAETFGLRAAALPDNPYEADFGGVGRRRLFALTRPADRPPPPKG
ncbi:MAG TPA: class I SAM-dependent methyltransferase [Fimbriiglobus sp.]|nr:class I SAM-dependent methyltransferase [Fimbriiglobus sp.]